MNRRDFFRLGAQSGLAAATAPLLFSSASERAFAQTTAPSSYKAVVLIELYGGNDANNMVIPLDAHAYAQYVAIRSMLALQQNAINPLIHNSGTAAYGLHWAMPNITNLFNTKRASIVANVGPLRQPVTKQQLSASPTLAPAQLFSHAVGRAQWECASADDSPQIGWGGRIGDLIATQSGQLPPVLNASFDSVFTVGRTVQGVAIQSNNGSFVPVPVGLTSAMAHIAQLDCQSPNQLVAQTAKVRLASTEQQLTLDSALQAGSTLKTQFDNSGFGNILKTIAQTINGRAVVGASRQIFFCLQGSYDSHTTQIDGQARNFIDLDNNIGFFIQALSEMGLSDQVLICTHSDFGRSFQPNTDAGTDHGWGSHHLLIGGGIGGGQILGTMPDFELGGTSDFNTVGTWIPTTAVTQMTAGIASWLGIPSGQIASIFPDLASFPAGALTFS